MLLNFVLNSRRLQVFEMLSELGRQMLSNANKYLNFSVGNFWTDFIIKLKDTKIKLSPCDSKTSLQRGE